MVAKSYQSLKQVGEPYYKNGKQYVVVLNENTGNKREVRWYTEAEYVKLYGSLPTAPKFKSQKEKFGFDNGFITIFKGDTYANLEWFRASIAKYNKLWGWYVESTEAIPVDLPVGLEPVELKWEVVGDEAGWLKEDTEIKEALNAVLYDAGTSEYQGTVGERMDIEVTITSIHYSDSYYGPCAIHYMEDAAGNQYLWNTKPRDWEVGDKYCLRGTVKDHKTIRNKKTTILTRCSLAK